MVTMEDGWLWRMGDVVTMEDGWLWRMGGVVTIYGGWVMWLLWRMSDVVTMEDGWLWRMSDVVTIYGGWWLLTTPHILHSHQCFPATIATFHSIMSVHLHVLQQLPGHSTLANDKLGAVQVIIAPRMIRQEREDLISGGDEVLFFLLNSSRLC